MNRFLLLPALAAAFAAALAPVAAVAAAPPIYLVVDFKADPHTPGSRRTVLVRAIDTGDADLCAHYLARYPNSPANPKGSQCVRELPAEFATLPQGGGIAKAYVLKFTTPSDPGASYRLMYDMSMKDPPQICRNLADYEQRFGHLSRDTRIQCWVPRA
jgi:hypothetical protein